MSHILFGEFSTELFELELIKKVKLLARSNGLFIYFEEEIDFYSDIQRMLLENNYSQCNYFFYLTSESQPQNSEDILFPYEKYLKTDLFPNGNERGVFNDICRENLNNLLGILIEFVNIFNPNLLRIFVTVGYDDKFKIQKCSIKDMIDDIYSQVISTICLDSKIYEIQLC